MQVQQSPAQRLTNPASKRASGGFCQGFKFLRTASSHTTYSLAPLLSNKTQSSGRPFWRHKFKAWPGPGHVWTCLAPGRISHPPIVVAKQQSKKINEPPLPVSPPQWGGWEGCSRNICCAAPRHTDLAHSLPVSIQQQS